MKLKLLLTIIFVCVACKNPTDCNNILYFSDSSNRKIMKDSTFHTHYDYIILTKGLVNNYNIIKDSTMNADSTFTVFYDTVFTKTAATLYISNEYNEYVTELEIIKGVDYEVGIADIGEYFSLFQIRLNEINLDATQGDISISKGNFIQDCSNW